ncbi:hypothetical protein ACJX0J_009277, partial [Zea mays]
NNFVAQPHKLVWIYDKSEFFTWSLWVVVATKNQFCVLHIIHLRTDIDFIAIKVKPARGVAISVDIYVQWLGWLKFFIDAAKFVVAQAHEIQLLVKDIVSLGCALPYRFGRYLYREEKDAPRTFAAAENGTIVHVFDECFLVIQINTFDMSYHLNFASMINKAYEADRYLALKWKEILQSFWNYFVKLIIANKIIVFDPWTSRYLY